MFYICVLLFTNFRLKDLILNCMHRARISIQMVTGINIKTKIEKRLLLIGELLCVEWARAEPYTSENLLTNRSENFVSTYVRTFLRLYLENLESRAITIATSLSLGILAMIN